MRHIQLLIACSFGLVQSANTNNYCTSKICNKCRSYLVRNYRDRLWLMCSALARNEKCCKLAFRGASSLFTVKNPRCDGLDADEQVLSGYMQMDVQYCQVGDDQLRNDLLNESDFNNDEICAPKGGQCFSMDQLIEEEKQAVPIFRAGDGPCKLRQNEFSSCAAVVAAEQMERVKLGLTYGVGGAFVAILIGMLLLLGKFYKQDRRRTEYNNCQRRVTSQEASSYAEGDDETKHLTSRNSHAQYQTEN